MKKAAKTKLPIPADTPRLSETLRGPRSPNRCQACSGAHSSGNALVRYLELDDMDRIPDPDVVTIVVLCTSCANKLIEPHPRAYKLLWQCEPFPGAMGVCLSCAHRAGVRCDVIGAYRRPLGTEGHGLTFGVSFTFDTPPTRAHLNYGGGRGEWKLMYSEPAKGCNGYDRHPRAPQPKEPVEFPGDVAHAEPSPPRELTRAELEAIGLETDPRKLARQKYVFTWWVEFTTGAPGCLETWEDEDGLAVAEQLTGRTVKGIKPLPYPATPLIRAPRLGETPCPPFCYTPSECAGRGSCNKRRACDD